MKSLRHSLFIILMLTLMLTITNCNPENCCEAPEFSGETTDTEDTTGEETTDTTDTEETADTTDTEETTASTSFSDDFSGDLSAWTDMGGSDWSIQNGELYGNYSVVCGSSTCPQADLILNDQYQLTDNWKASIDFIRVVDATHSDLYQAQGNFSLWLDSNNKISISIGSSGWNSWGGSQTVIRLNIQQWDGSWESIMAEEINYNWDPEQWHKASLEKQGSTYSMYIDDTYLGEFVDDFLNGQGKIGLHTYGTKKYDNFLLEAQN